MKSKLFDDRKYIITGASAGIGLSFAEALHQKGCRVVLVARREERLKSTVEKLNAIRPDSASYLCLDLSNLDAVRSFSKECFSDPEIFGFISNAGFGSFGEFVAQDLAQEEAMVSVNCHAAVILLHYAARAFRERGEGAIVQLSSVAGFISLPYMSTYSATKAFDLHLALGLYYELKPFGVRVLSVCPGPVETEFGQVAHFPSSKRGMVPGDSADAVVRESLCALEKGKPIVIPGLKGRLVGLGRLFPKTFTSWCAWRHLRSFVR